MLTDSPIWLHTGRKTKMPRVSVVIPTFNRERYVRGALESVLKQTFRDLEIIVCDDGSTDKTVEIVRSIRNDAGLPFRIEMLPFNLGVSAARNKAISLAKGEWIAFLDSDDSWKVDKLEKQVAFLDDHPDFIGVGCNFENVQSGGSLSSQYGPYYFPDASSELFQLLYDCYITTSCFMVKKDTLILAGLFDLSLKNSEDRDLWWRLPALGRIGYINEPLVRYRIHDASVSKRRSGESCKTYIPVVEKTLWYYKDSLTVQERRKIMSRSHLMVAYDAAEGNCFLLSVKHALLAMLFGKHLLSAGKHIVFAAFLFFRQALQAASAGKQ